MKKLLACAAVAVLAAGFLFSFGGSCSSSGGLPPYYVKFEADGEEYVFDLGLTDIEKNAFANVVMETETWFVAVPDSVDSGLEPDTYVIVVLGGTEAKTYYAGVDSEIQMRFSWEGTYYDLVEGSLTISKFGEVGGAIEGTFSGSMAVNVGPQGARALPDEFAVTDGEFKVKRIADDSWSLKPQ